MKIFFYQKSSGREPVREALNNLPQDERANAYAKLADIERYGLAFCRVRLKLIKGKLWEIKYKFRNQHRILYCLKDAQTMVLLHYVKKKTAKLAISDRDIAEKRMSEVLKHDQ